MKESPFSHSAELYDVIYGSFKDYASEAATIAELLRQLNPQCTTILDVACGTAGHARFLAEAGFIIDGLDIEPAFVEIARRKHPRSEFFVADMCDFQLPRRYDAVICLFSSIGYLKSLESVANAFSCFRQHLAPRGTIVVEPWFTPGVLDPTRVTQAIGEAEGVRVIRSNRVELEPRLSRLLFEYEITDATGTRHAHEIHELALFTKDELIDAFRRAGLDPTYDPQGLTGRGLYVARPTVERGSDAAGHSAPR